MQVKSEVTIKPVDKNLGIVILNTDDYLAQCAKHLSDTITHRLVNSFHKNEFRRQITNTVIVFKTQL